MNKIRVLQPNLANKIAAGEVVDRPMSVVKELLENAVDAGSTAISVEMKGGGIESIRVTDNGCGIPSEEVRLAFERHATSKISEAEDLEHIDTLGFRGEALSSIAAVSAVSMHTRTQNTNEGTEALLKGGSVLSVKPAGCPEGTSIEVSDLFYNVPARLKFLKTARTEGSYISDYVSRMILAHPEISFRLKSNNKTVYESMGDGKLKTAIYSVYGNDVLPHLNELTYDDGYVAVSGYLGTEEIARPNRQQQSFFVNGRFIRSTRLSYAIQRVFDTRLMVGRYPFAVVSLKISSREVDVNVHPNKLEVRFRDEERVLRAVTIAARKALGDYIPPEAVNPKNSAYVNQTEENRSAPGTFTAEKKTLGRLPEYNRPLDRYSDETIRKTPATPTQTPLSVRDVITKSPLTLNEKLEAHEAARTLETVSKSAPAPVPVIRIEPKAEPEQKKPEPPEQLKLTDDTFLICGKLFETYWMVQQGENVFLIDQHAAHERSLYEKVIQNVTVDSQQLLLPMVVKLTPLEFDTFRASSDRFSELGYEIEEFGVLTVCVRAVPYLMGEPQSEAFLHEALAALSKGGKACAAELKRASLIQFSCKHAVKGGNSLSREEITALLAEFTKNGVPLTCPHGRPVMVRLSRGELEKMFKRVL